MNTNETKVDVLAVMDAARERLESQDRSVAYYQMNEARAIIAELIDVAREKQRVTGGGPVVTVTESLAAYRRMEAVLARIGGAA